MRRFLLALILCLWLPSAFCAERQIINIGTHPGDKTGDSDRVAWTKGNANFEELFNRTAGGLSSNASQVAALALSSIVTNSAAWRAAMSTTPDTIYVTWYSTNGVLNSTQIQAALNDGAGKTVIFPSSGTYNVTSTVLPKSGTHILGYGATIRNGDPTYNGTILMAVEREQNVVLEGLTFDCNVSSHYNVGGLWIRGSTNVLTKNCTLKNAGYLANYVVGSSSGATSENCDIEGSRILDQRYGGSGQSTANLSIAEGARDCDIRDCVIDYPLTGTLGLSYVPLGTGNPNAPTLAISLDRAFNTRVIGTTIRNTSGQTNLVGLILEDNSGAQNIFTTVESTLIDGMDVGTAFAYLYGRATYTDCTFRNCTRWAARMNQTEEADQHHIESVTFNHCRFIDNYSSPTMGQNNLGYWRNQGGQVSYVSNPPYRLTLLNCEFSTTSANSGFSHVLWGGGDLFVENCLFKGGATGIRAMDPIQPDPITPNGYYHAGPEYRKVFSSRRNRFSGVTSPIYGISDTWAPDNFTDSAPKYFVEDCFPVSVTTNTLTRLFSIKTVDSDKSSVGRSGAFFCEVQMLVTPQDTSSQLYGSMSGRGASFGFSYASNHDTPSTVATSPIVSFGMTPQAMVGSRGFANIVPSLASPNPYTTDVQLTLDGEGDATVATVYCRVRVLHSGFYTAPCIVR